MAGECSEGSVGNRQGGKAGQFPINQRHVEGSGEEPCQWQRRNHVSTVDEEVVDQGEYRAKTEKNGRQKFVYDDASETPEVQRTRVEARGKKETRRREEEGGTSRWLWH